MSGYFRMCQAEEGHEIASPRTLSSLPRAGHRCGCQVAVARAGRCNFMRHALGRPSSMEHGLGIVVRIALLAELGSEGEGRHKGCDLKLTLQLRLVHGVGCAA